MTDSPYLVAAGATWDDDADAGAWIAARLGPVGTSVGHAVPHGYDAYAVVPSLPRADDGAADTYELLVDALAAVTGDQPVHCGLWEGWGFLYDPGTDPRYAPGMGAFVAWDDEAPDPAEQRRARDEALAAMALLRVERPAAPPLHLPHRAYHLWTGPLRAALALRHEAVPSLVWPEDRTWFLGAPIYTRELAVGGPAHVVDALLADPRLAARRATPDDLLDIDD